MSRCQRKKLFLLKKMHISQIITYEIILKQLFTIMLGDVSLNKNLAFGHSHNAIRFFFFFWGGGCSLHKKNTGYILLGLNRASVNWISIV